MVFHALRLESAFTFYDGSALFLLRTLHLVVVGTLLF